MEECLICNSKFDKNIKLTNHIKKHHNINRREYNIKFCLLHYCPICNLELSKKNKTGYCNKHRDRSGENNSFFGKKHSIETINKLKEKCSIASREKWTILEYRNKVIKNSSKPRSNHAKVNISNAVKEWYKNNPNENEKRKIYMKQYWKNGNIVSNNFSCNKSKMEDDLYENINRIFPTALKNQCIKDTNNKRYFPDILIEECNLCIEFFGDYWHANPKKFNSDDILRNFTAKQIWENDRRRIYNLENNIPNKNYKVIIVWQDDYTNSKDLVLQNIYKHINDRLHIMET